MDIVERSGEDNLEELPTRLYSMTGANHNGNNTSSHARTASESSSGSHYTLTNKSTRPKRTRSQLAVSDLIPPLPLSHSPLKAARKAGAKPRGISPISHPDSRLHSTGNSQSPPAHHGEVVWVVDSAVTETVTPEISPKAELGEEMDAGADGQSRKNGEEEESEDSLFSESDRESSSAHKRWPPSTKKRPSPETDTTRTFSSPRNERHAKRAKLEAFRSLGREQEHMEYREPLRDPDASSPSRSKNYKRASSTKPTPSPSEASSSIFPRAQSVPLGGEDAVPAIDFTSVPPSPRRSQSKGTVEIRRAPSAPPQDEEPMDIDDESNLVQFTNATHVASPQANPMFQFTVNFATPREAATLARTARPPASPLSPLSPLTPSPPAGYFPRMTSLLAKKAMANSSSSRKSGDTSTNSAVSLTIPLSADTTALDVFQSTAHVPRRPSSAASTSSPGAAASAASQPHLQHPLASSKSMELMLPPAFPQRVHDAVQGAAGGSSKGKDAALNESDVSVHANLPSALTSRLGPISIPRRTVIGSMKPKRGLSVPQGTKRVTRSVSMKEQRVKCERAEIENVTTEGAPGDTTDSVMEPASEVTEKPPSLTTSPSKLRPPNSTNPALSQLKIPSARRRSASVSKFLPNTSKLKQTSLHAFVKGKPPTTGGAATSSSLNASTSSNIVGLSKTPTVSSPSKIPLPASPSKRPSTAQSVNSKPHLFSPGSTSTGAGNSAAHATSGRTLSTLSHALDKLAAPPPSRPNTSMGFVRSDGSNEGDSVPEKAKGKGKAKDDASLPRMSTTQVKGTAFTRPTASSLKRASTVTGVGSMTTARMRGLGAGPVGLGRGRGVFGKVGDRASKKTTLPVVAGSPVKGSGVRDDTDDDDLQLGRQAPGLPVKPTASEETVLVSQDIDMQDVSAKLLTNDGRSAAERKPSPPSAAPATNGTPIDLTSSPISADKGKQRAMPPSTLNLASAALHALSESLSSLPQTPTPPKPRVLGTRMGLRSSTTAKESPTDSSSAGPGGNGEVHGSGGTGPSGGTVNGSGGVKKSSLKILKQCAIFVDVRTEQGDDAGSLFVDMLKGLGAKIMGRLGQSCTHIVYKNGLPHTLTRYRMLNDPKPIVIGIAWVVECVEKRARVDEERFKVDVDMINVAGGNTKRRRSMLPKHMIPVSPGPDFDMPAHMSSEADEEEDGAGGVDGSPSQDPDISTRSREEDDLPPLERARRRRSVLPGGQMRLFS